MKQFRSHKNLKPVQPHIRQQANLKMKIKMLEQQILFLQKNSMNVFTPITQHSVSPEVPDFQSIINKLRQQVMNLEQEGKLHKQQIHRLQREKDEIKKEYEHIVGQLKEKIVCIQAQKREIKEQLQQCEDSLEEKKKECEELDRLVIQKNVELKFLAEELHEEKVKSANWKQKHNDLSAKVSAVLNSSNVHKSLTFKMICIEKEEYDRLKGQIESLKALIRALEEANRREKVTLGTKKSDIGEQIVRLKKNIDVQLGLGGDSKHSEEFLKVYRGTHDLFHELINQCKNTNSEGIIKD